MYDYLKIFLDISLKFSAYVHHITALIWYENFGHCLLRKTAVPSIKEKLWNPPEALFVDILSRKIFWRGFRPI